MCVLHHVHLSRQAPTGQMKHAFWLAVALSFSQSASVLYNSLRPEFHVLGWLTEQNAWHGFWSARMRTGSWASWLAYRPQRQFLQFFAQGLWLANRPKRLTRFLISAYAHRKSSLMVGGWLTDQKDISQNSVCKARDFWLANRPKRLTRFLISTHGHRKSSGQGLVFRVTCI